MRIQIMLSRVRALAFCAATLICCSCAQEQIEYQSNGFNRAIEQTTNELLLLNIVRSSMDLPLYFTKLIKYSGQNMVSGSIAPKLPFGPKAVASYDAGVTTNWNGGVSAIEFADLNQDEGLAGLRAPVQFYVFDQYFQSNYSWMVLATLLFDGFDVSGTVNQGLIWNYKRYCTNQAGKAACEYIAYIKGECGDYWIETAAIPYYNDTDGSFVTHTNSGKTKCEYLRFQAFLAVLSIAGFVTDLEEGPAKSVGVKAKEKTKEKTKEKDSGSDTSDASASPRKYYIRTRFAYAPEVNAAALHVDARLKVFNRQAIAPLMRAPKRMIEFLGELTSLQVYQTERYIPKTLVRRSMVNLFRVERSDGAAPTSSLFVRGPRGETFNVPQPDLSIQDRDQSLIVLSLVNDMVNLATKKASFPTPTAIEVRTQQ
jgi:hypothetical protein